MKDRAILHSRLAASESLKAIHKRGKKAYREDKGRKAKITVRTKSRGKLEIEKRQRRSRATSDKKMKGRHGAS